MVKDTTSPFTPGTPVSTEFFVGREQEIRRLRQKMLNALSGRVEVAYVAGERGIGKSSLARFVSVLCEDKLDVLAIHALMAGATTVEDAVGRIFNRLIKEKGFDSSIGEKIRSFFGDRVKEVGLFGVSMSFEPQADELAVLARDFAPALHKLYETVSDSKKGILLVIDDINGLATSESFCNWLKSFVDELALSRQNLPLFLMFVGFDEHRRSMIELQPSLARVLDVVDIAAWSNEETRAFFSSAFDEIDVSVESDSLDLMSDYAGGLPMLAHEIGDATLSADTDGHIGFEDAQQGVLAAAEVVGRKYVDPVVMSSFRSEKYRAILRTLASMPAAYGRFTRAEVLETLGSAETKVFDNCLRKMKGLGVLIEDTEGGRGAYRFGTRLHHLYLSMEAWKAERPQA